MLSTKMQDALNEQINAELWSAYLYLSMAMHFEAAGRPGVANWYKVQWQEENAHAEILRNWVNSRGGRVVLKAIDAVPTEWASELDAFESTLAHEQKVTALINNLYAGTDDTERVREGTITDQGRHDLAARPAGCKSFVNYMPGG